MIASIMLVAVASLVLHGSAMAAASAARPVHGDSRIHDHATAHAPSAAQARAEQPGSGSGHVPGHGGPQGDVCGVCGQTAIVPALSHVVPNRVAARSVAAAFSVDGRGIVQEGLRRPPRAPDIA